MKEDYIEWLLAMVLPNPEVCTSREHMTRTRAKYIYSTCFKGEEYENAFSLTQQSFAALREQEVFLRVVQGLPEYSHSKGHSDEYPSEECSEWDEQGPDEPAHFPEGMMALVRNVIITKLVIHCGLLVRCVLSQDKRHLVLLITCTPHDLMREADRQSFPAELNICTADPESLEPCTKTFYPLLDWYFWHQQEDSSAEMRDLLQGTLTSLQEAYHDAPEFVKNHHMHSMEFWERYSKKTTDAAQKKCGDHYGSVTMNSNIAEMMEGGDRSLHIGNERVRDEVRMGFEEYLRQKQKVPLMYPLQLMQLANEGQQGHSRQELKNYYDTLGVPLIPPHSGFEVGTYAGPGATPWIWRHFNIRLLGSHEHVSVPFRRHQIIKLASDIIGRQLDVQRLVELGYVKCLFPLDSRDKVEVPVDWVNTSDEEAGNKFWFNLQSGEVSWDKPRSSSLRAHELYELPRTPQGASREKQDPAGEQGFSEVGQSQCPSEQVSSEVARSALEQGSSEVARSASEAPEAEDDLISSVRSESDLRLPSELLQSWGFPDPHLPLLQKLRILCSSFLRPPSIHVIRDYYGEEIAMYFALAHHLCWWCMVPAGVGIVSGAVLQAYPPDQRYQGIALAFRMFHGVVISCWGTVWLEAWKRNETMIATMWGQRGTTSPDAVRPAFRGIPRRSPVNFKNDMDMFGVMFFSKRGLGQIPRIIVSYLIILALCLAHIVVMLLLLQLRSSWIRHRWLFAETSHLIVGVLLACQMCVMSILGSFLCPALNDWENYRTEQQYANHLIVKMTVIEIVSQFTLFFYTAFFKGIFEGCVVVDNVTQVSQLKPRFANVSILQLEEFMCLDELTSSVTLILIALAGMNVIEIVVPAWVLPMMRGLWGKNSVRQLLRENSMIGEFTRDGHSTLTSLVNVIDIMMKKEEYSSVGHNIDYMELVVVFGHISLFSVSFPFAPLIVMVLVLIEIRVDGHKLFYTVRRPMPRNAETIGAWHHVFQTLTWLSVLTNTLICVWGAADQQAQKKGGELGERHWLETIFGLLVLSLFKVITFLVMSYWPHRIQVLWNHHKSVCQILVPNDKSLKPRDVNSNDLDTRIYEPNECEWDKNVDFRDLGQLRRSSADVRWTML